MKEYLTFNDVLLRPQFSRITSRAEVDVGVGFNKFGLSFSKKFQFKHPFIPANMASVIGFDLLRVMYQSGGLSILHRFMPIEEQIRFLIQAEEVLGENIFDYLGISVGVKEKDKKNLWRLVETGIKIICLDIAHADSVRGLEMVRYITEEYPGLLLIAGNVATAEGMERLFRAGADIVKIGVGSSGICSTRLETGNGVPQLGVVMECHYHRLELQNELKKELYLISDGGHSTSGDCVKSLCFADMVMLGGMFAKTEEAAGEMVPSRIVGKKYKKYQGSSTHKVNRIEGVKALVECSGSAEQLLTKLKEGLQSGCSYQNAFNLKELRERADLIRITNAGWKETQIHDVASIE